MDPWTVLCPAFCSEGEPPGVTVLLTLKARAIKVGRAHKHSVGFALITPGFCAALSARDFFKVQQGKRWWQGSWSKEVRVTWRQRATGLPPTTSLHLGQRKSRFSQNTAPPLSRAQAQVASARVQGAPALQDSSHSLAVVQAWRHLSPSRDLPGDSADAPSIRIPASPAPSLPKLLCANQSLRFTPAVSSCASLWAGGQARLGVGEE